MSLPVPNAQSTQHEADADHHRAVPQHHPQNVTRLGAERMHRELLTLLNEERPKVTA